MAQWDVLASQKMTEELELSYNTLKSEVAVFRSSIAEKAAKNEQAKRYYKGCTIMFSHLKENPPFLFIGINPGAGTKDDLDLNPCAGFEYLNAEQDKYDYALARNTRDVFKRAGLDKHLEHSVKTNFYYFTTTKAGDLGRLFPLLGDDVNNEFHRLAYKWTKQMIELVKPQAIICEGMAAFKEVGNLYRIKQTELETGCGYFELENRAPVIGYSRRYSDIKNKVFVAEFLKRKIGSRLNR